MNLRRTKPGLPARVVTFLLAAGFVLPFSIRMEAAITLVPKETVITGLNASGLTLSFQIGVVNDGSAEKRLVRTRYRVAVNRQEFLSMDVALDEPLVVPAVGELLIALPVKITYDLLFKAVGPVEVKAVCEATGEMFFESERRRVERVAFAHSSEFPVFKDPEVEFLPLKVHSLTLGGADVALRLRFRNAVNWELIVDRIRIRLVLGGSEVLDENIPGEKSIPAGGGRVFEIPFLVDFFDQGPELRSKFESGILPYRLAGELEIASVWGKILVLFDTSGDVAVEK